MSIRDWFRNKKRDVRTPVPSAEALKVHAEVRHELRPRAEAAATERRKLLRENNFAPRIQAIYRGEA